MKIRPTLSRLGIVVFLIAVGSSCFVGRVWVVDYKFDTAALRGAAGEEVALSTRGAGRDVDLIATDDRGEFTFRVEPGRIRLSIENRGEEAFSFDLSGASYVDSSGRSHRLFVAEGELPEHRTVELSPHSTAQFSVWPEDWNQGFHEGRPIVFRDQSPLGGSTLDESSRERALGKRGQDLGRSFEIRLPLLVADERVFYRFRFTVTELVARRIWWA